jgi:hypothetical protein
VTMLPFDHTAVTDMKSSWNDEKNLCIRLSSHSDKYGKERIGDGQNE